MEDLEDPLLATYHRVRSQPNAILCVGGGIATLPAAPPSSPAPGPRSTASRACPSTRSRSAPSPWPAPRPRPACRQGRAARRRRRQPCACRHWRRRRRDHQRQEPARRRHPLPRQRRRPLRPLDAVAGDAAKVAARRDEIIAALAATARPYFGDIEAMSWLDAAHRLVALLATGRGGPYEDGPWPDRSYRERVADFIRMAEARLTEAATTESVIDAALTALDDPEAALAAFAAAYPAAADRRVHPADARAFVGRICARPGKPVSFVPVIDADVRRWYKADSLGAAQDDRHPADAVLVIPGPEAVAGIERADEPVAELLARFEQGAVDALTAAGHSPRRRPRRFGADETRGPIAELLAAPALIEGRRRVPNPIPALCPALPGARVTHERQPGTGLDRRVWSDPASGDRVTLTARADGGVTLALDTAPLTTGEGAARYTLELAPGPRDGAPAFVIEPEHARDALRDCYHRALFGAPVAPADLFMPARDRVTVDPDRAAAYTRLAAAPADAVAAPFAFSLCWAPLFRVISCDALAAGLMRLVHLDQSVEPLAGWPIAPGDTLDVEARVVDVVDRDRGRIVRAVATLTRGETPVARLRSGFFIRGDHATTPYRRRRHEEITVELRIADAAAAEFLADAALATFTEAPAAGDTLTLTATLVETRPRTGPARYTADGHITRAGAIIATIQLDTTGGEQHPLDALVTALGGPLTAAPVDTPRRTLATEATRTPAHLDAFAEIGLDHNPIHRSPAFARLAGLRGPIVHGMWTAARLHGFVARTVAAGHPERIRDQRVEFTAPALPGEPITLTAARVAMHRGDLIVEATATATRGETAIPIARTRFTVRPPRTAYVFPGQGIQRRGMGMADYARSPAARAIWDRADAVTRRRLGFSILAIVRDNPRELVVDGEHLAHPDGVLHLTRFTQPAMAVLAMAQMAALREAGVVAEDAVAAGHSVGEYDALAAVFEVLPLEAVVEIVYQRGCVMHRYVPRDAHGRSDYRMGVIRPRYAGLDQAGALALVDRVAAQTGRFIQVVNYNVRDRQYAVTGHADALDALAAALAARDPRKPAWLEVPGVDVPFHSAVLRDGVDAFRQTLRDRLPARIDPARLVGRYVPNLVAEVFSLDRGFVERVGEVSGSPIIAALLTDLDAHDPADLCRAVLVELLAWQFASPVRWIETQELMLRPRAAGGLGVERVIEVGVGYQPTVANMLRQTLAGLDRPVSIEVQNAEADADRVFARDADPATDRSASPGSAAGGGAIGGASASIGASAGAASGASGANASVGASGNASGGASGANAIGGANPSLAPLPSASAGASGASVPSRCQRQPSPVPMSSPAPMPSRVPPPRPPPRPPAPPPPAPHRPAGRPPHRAPHAPRAASPPPPRAARPHRDPRRALRRRLLPPQSGPPRPRRRVRARRPRRRPREAPHRARRRARRPRARLPPPRRLPPRRP
ncbi:MAG: DUF1729 domain-containing protein [bacterium]